MCIDMHRVRDVHAARRLRHDWVGELGVAVAPTHGSRPGGEADVMGARRPRELARY